MLEVMKPGVYLNCLERVAERDDLAICDLHPVMMADVMALESELAAQLPEQYEEFLTEVGTGTEHGGLGIWFHLDLSRTGNILEISDELRRRMPRALPAGFLAVYESRGDGIYGFVRGRGGRFQDEVFCLDPESGVLDQTFSNLYEFLDDNLDLGEHEIELAERRYRHQREVARPPA